MVLVCARVTPEGSNLVIGKGDTEVIDTLVSRYQRVLWCCVVSMDNVGLFVIAQYDRLAGEVGSGALQIDLGYALAVVVIGGISNHEPRMKAHRGLLIGFMNLYR